MARLSSLLRGLVAAASIALASCGGSEPVSTCTCTAVDACCDGCAPIPRVLACEGGGGPGLCSGGICNPATRSVFATHDAAYFVHDVRFSPDGSMIAAAAETTTSGMGGEVVVRGLDGTALHTLEGAAWSVGFSPDGALLAAGTSPVRVLSTSDWSTVATLEGTSGAVAFSPDGAYLAAGAVPDVVVYRTSDWSEAGRVTQADSDRERIWSVLFTADSQRLLTGTGQLGFGSPHGDTTVWRVSDLSEERVLDCTTLSLRLTEDGSRLVAACWADVRIFDTTTWERVTTVTAGAAMQAITSRDGSLLFFSNFDGPIEVVDLATRVPFEVVEGPDMQSSFKGLAFRPGTFELYASGWASSEILRFDLSNLGEP